MALIAAAVAVAVVAFIALKPSDSSKKQSSVPATTPTAGTKTTGQKPAPPPIPTIVVKNGKPVGGIKQLTFNKGDRIKFTVKSDVSDEVHVHGYDLMKDVAPGKPVTFSFKGNIDGEFEAELEGRKEQIIALTVNP
jgi:heme/copper-type cytochrome/quinol oxidase subunit 2